jgi:uncharacterized membrane-anchored protein YitT (DUF2179 family)
VNASAPASRHGLLDDMQALVTGTLFVALALVLFRQAGLVTGGTAGLAFTVHYALGWPFGLAFFVINVPFYLLAWRRMGPAFTIKTFAAVGLLSLLAEAVPGWVVLQSVQPLFAALGGGLLMGAGLLILFRHRASLGGLNVLVLWLQDTRGWRAGKVQMALDGLILLAAAPWVGWAALVLSVLAAVALNLALAVNHKPGRYAAV